MSVAVEISITAKAGGNGLSASCFTPLQCPSVNATAPGGVPVEVVLASGANAIVSPAGTARCILVPPKGSTVAKQAATVEADTGISFTADFVAFPVAGGATVYVTSASVETLQVVWG